MFLGVLVVVQLLLVFEYLETGSTAEKGTKMRGLMMLDAFPGPFNELIANTESECT